MTDDTKKKPARKRKAKGPLPDELIDLLLCELEGKDAESVLGSSGLAGRLKKQLAERLLAAELSHHLDTEAEPAATSRQSQVTIATAPAPRLFSRPMGRCPWTFHATDFRSSSRSSSPSTSGACPASTIT